MIEPWRVEIATAIRSRWPSSRVALADRLLES